MCSLYFISFHLRWVFLTQKRFCVIFFWKKCANVKQYAWQCVISICTVHFSLENDIFGKEEKLLVIFTRKKIHYFLTVHNGCWMRTILLDAGKASHGKENGYHDAPLFFFLYPSKKFLKICFSWMLTDVIFKWKCCHWRKCFSPQKNRLVVFSISYTNREIKRTNVH